MLGYHAYLTEFSFCPNKIGTHSNRENSPVPISLSHMNSPVQNTKFFVALLELVTVSICPDESFIADETLDVFQFQETFRHAHVSDTARATPSNSEQLLL